MSRALPGVGDGRGQEGTGGGQLLPWRDVCQELVVRPPTDEGTALRTQAQRVLDRPHKGGPEDTGPAQEVDPQSLASVPRLHPVSQRDRHLLTLVLRPPVPSVPVTAATTAPLGRNTSVHRNTPDPSAQTERAQEGGPSVQWHAAGGAPWSWETRQMQMGSLFLGFENCVYWGDGETPIYTHVHAHLCMPGAAWRDSPGLPHRHCLPCRTQGTEPFCRTWEPWLHTQPAITLQLLQTDVQTLLPWKRPAGPMPPLV